ncbi:MAG: hypothetical protein DRP50_04950 [Thermotoga sp.]|nr:MAG: hypothetical protein DRP50_04950 [Thermotoga sp.]
MKNEEIMKILKMIEDHKISAQEGMELIDSLEMQKEKKENVKKVLKIMVFDKQKSQRAADITIPFKLATLAFKFIPQDALKEMDKEGMSREDLLEMLKSTEIPDLLKVDTDQYHVEISIERV